jgi:hypothetical protein
VAATALLPKRRVPGPRGVRDVAGGHVSSARRAPGRRDAARASWRGEPSARAGGRPAAAGRPGGRRGRRRRRRRGRGARPGSDAAAAEGQVGALGRGAVRPALGAEALGLREGDRIALQQRDREQDDDPGRQRVAGDRSRLGEPPQDADGGRAQPQRLAQHGVARGVARPRGGEPPGQCGLPGQAVEQPGQRDGVRLVGGRGQRDELVGDRRGGQRRVGGGQAADHVPAVVAAPTAPALDLLGQERGHRRAPVGEERRSGPAQEPVALAGDRHRRVARRPQHPADRRHQRAGAPLLVHPEHEPDEHLVEQAAQARQQPERPAARPLGDVALGDRRHAGVVAGHRLRREGRRHPPARSVVLRPIAAEHGARRGERQDVPAPLTGARADRVAVDGDGLGQQAGRWAGRQRGVRPAHPGPLPAARAAATRRVPRQRPRPLETADRAPATTSP